MTGTYAAETAVTPDRSRGEIERTLERYGASHFAYASSPDRATVMFRVGQSTVRLTVPLPEAAEFRLTPTRQTRSKEAAAAAREKAVRQRWRALALVVKAKLEAVESGLVTFEQEWYAYLVLPNGETVYEHTEAAYRASLVSGSTLPRLGIGA